MDQFINGVLTPWWANAYVAAMRRMRADGWSWPELGRYMGMDPSAARQVYGEPLYNGDCGYGVVPEEWHHGVAGPPMTDAPADRCER